MIIAPTAYF